MTNYGIARDHIFYSRDATFLQGVMGKTNGQGVDVVLNSLSGELLHTAWKCLAEFGVFVELGIRDIGGQARLEMQTFATNRTFVGFDLLHISKKRPALIQRCEKALQYRFGTMGQEENYKY